MILIGQVVYYKGVPYYLDVNPTDGQRLRHIPSGMPLIPDKGIDIHNQTGPGIEEFEPAPLHVPDFVREKLDDEWFGKDD